MRTAWQKRAAESFDHMLSFGCESPIEQLFLAAMVIGETHGSWSQSEVYDWCRQHKTIYSLSPGSDHQWRSVLLSDSTYGGWCATQCTVIVDDKLFRLDFAFFGANGRRIAVELDGHDFHERTKQQAARDKSRDRTLSASGWTCLRFTGSEVYADPSECVRQVEHFLIEDAASIGVSTARVSQ